MRDGITGKLWQLVEGYHTTALTKGVFITSIYALKHCSESQGVSKAPWCGQCLCMVPGNSPPGLLNHPLMLCVHTLQHASDLSVFSSTVYVITIYPSGGLSAVRLKQQQQQQTKQTKKQNQTTGVSSSPPESGKGLGLNPQSFWVPPVCLCDQNTGTSATPEAIQSTHIGKSGQNQPESVILYGSSYASNAEI